MTMRKLVGPALLAGAAFANPAAAQTTGVYVGLGVGGQLLTETINRRAPSGLITNQNQGQQQGSNFLQGMSARFSPGVIANASFGFGFGGGFRAEVEGFYRTNSINEARLGVAQNFATNQPIARGGNYRGYGFMVNALYDFDLSPLGGIGRWLVPYVGAGIGFAQLEMRDVEFTTPTTQNQNQQVTQRTFMNGNARGLAYQAIVGAAVPLESVVPGLSLTAEYRYFGTTTPRFRVGQVNINQQQQQQQQQGGTPTVQQPFVLELGRAAPTYSGHSVTLGLRYALDAPRPVAPVAAGQLGFTPPVFRQQQLAPQGRNFVVFFPLNSAALDAGSRGTVAEAAQAARSFGSTSLDVVGQADATGNSAANRSLAQRRAQAVVAELARQGVPRSAVRVSTQPTGAAGDASARRVDITLN
jgi:outer membrane protein OmpA-like peptidoglycan-associated protein